jgi:FKBP-type peptidyl-prolyl cis-trans isomerase SlyD
MKIDKNTVVSFEYTLTNEGGDVLDKSEGRGPLAYLHGHSNIIPGLENELTGKAVGDSLVVTVSPDQGYGMYDASLLSEIPKSEFGADADTIEKGMQLQLQTDDGLMLVQVTKVAEDAITIDGNHPLAGETLTFDVTIASVRVATDEELEHGHVHGEGGHHH